MKRIILALTGLLFTCGCVAVLVGAGVVTGYTLSSDSAIGNIKASYRIVWDNSQDVMQNMQAEIVDTNESKGIIKAKISGHDVTVRINTIGNDVQNLKVSARKLLLPKPQFAQKVFFKITENLTSD